MSSPPPTPTPPQAERQAKTAAQSQAHGNHPSFGPYKLIRTVGEGEFGKVKLSIDTRSNDEVAIKLLRKDRISNPARRAKVMREITMLQSLDHPFVVSLKEVVENEAYIGLVMQFASGGEMFHYIMAQPDGRLTEREGKKFFAQLVSGVSYIHSVGIVHRDLKLENLLLGPDNNVLISDFGFANKNSEHMETSCGSPGYAAPELVVSNYILHTKLTYPSHLSAPARNIIGIMLVPDPKNRGKMSDVMSHAWLSSESHIFQAELERRLKRFGLDGKPEADGKQVVPDSSKSGEPGETSTRPSTVSIPDERLSISVHRGASVASKGWFWSRKASPNGAVTPTLSHKSITSPTESIAPSIVSVDMTPSRSSTTYSLSNSDYGGARERVLRYHAGPVDKNAMSPRDPLELLIDLETLFEQKLGWIVQSNGLSSGEFKLKVSKPRGVKIGAKSALETTDDTAVPDTTNAVPADSAAPAAENNITSAQAGDAKMKQIVDSLPVSLMKRIRNFVYTLGPNASKGFDGKPLAEGEGVTGMEEEMTFTVEVQKIKDLKGMHVVEFKRIKGDVWCFKRLYGILLADLPLQDR
ncbi:hypothetical protein CcCBS67573_g01139 [Chytriomyces confervae]|uniref:Non-specific serine/threonine protein kinase n=1 Tax=Chytriomyces confervae TaxID=246404 RepID=A0A507FPI6_9FUNG|nr:hypothetical protein CcCBS67573_g01139 [Chytriomyces confervae]